jgi:hypothetical protein
MRRTRGDEDEESIAHGGSLSQVTPGHAG